MQVHAGVQARDLSAPAPTCCACGPRDSFSGSVACTQGQAPGAPCGSRPTLRAQRAQRWRAAAAPAAPPSGAQQQQVSLNTAVPRAPAWRAVPPPHGHQRYGRAAACRTTQVAAPAAAAAAAAPPQPAGPQQGQPGTAAPLPLDRGFVKLMQPLARVLHVPTEVYAREPVVEAPRVHAELLPEKDVGTLRGGRCGVRVRVRACGAAGAVLMVLRPCGGGAAAWRCRRVPPSQEHAHVPHAAQVAFHVRPRLRPACGVRGGQLRPGPEGRARRTGAGAAVVSGARARS